MWYVEPLPRCVRELYWQITNESTWYILGGKIILLLLFGVVCIVATLV